MAKSPFGADTTRDSYVSASDGSRPKRLTPGGGRSDMPASPTWSTDGKWLAFALEVDRTDPTHHFGAGIWLTRDDGTQAHRVPHTEAADDAPAWLPPA